ncbi:MAG: CocE/NonD family hydrolase [bacterium]|nr:CocE/NonD family hydrolase [bacterium]
MKNRTHFPRTVREIEHTWIPLSDGTRLAARIWLPEDAEDDPVPAVLEYLPYRKNDFTAVRDSVHHPYFAGHGYASMRVDIRGSGDSDGVLYDEYLPLEQEDALEVLAWIAKQPWSTGAVGLYGKSWGGFNGLQIAAHRPPELKAVISLCSTDDRYADDVHYMGGCVLASKMLYWASTMLLFNARPPDPRHVGDAWREMWLERLEQSPPFIETWLSHQLRDGYWEQGSVCEDFSAITCPVYAVGGWADAYTNAIPRLLEGLSCPKKGLIGPWAHDFPERASPGPAIGFLQECLRWWDRWLKGIETGIMDEPMLRVWMQESKLPDVSHESWPGRWITEKSWPSSQISGQAYGFQQAAHGMGVLDEGGDSSLSLIFQSKQNVGKDAGNWCSYGVPGEFPPDQRAEDGRSLTFTSRPLNDPLDVLGFPEVTVELSVDRPNALLAVRLCEVFPSGASTRLSWGLLNLTHRHGHQKAVPLEPGEQYEVTVRLNAVGCRIASGNRLRVALSETYWPEAWPSPEPVTVHLLGGTLNLPVRAAVEESDIPAFEIPEGAPELKVETLREGGRERTYAQDILTGQSEIRVGTDSGRIRFDNGLETELSALDTWTIQEADPLSAEAQCEWTTVFKRGTWETRVETKSRMWSDGERFYVSNEVTAYEGSETVFSRTRTFDVEREGC